jgi:hypothetical protein
MPLNEGMVFPAVEEELREGSADQAVGCQAETTEQGALDERDTEAIVGDPDGRREIGEDSLASGVRRGPSGRTRSRSARSGWRAGRICFSHGSKSSKT